MSDDISRLIASMMALLGILAFIPIMSILLKSSSSMVENGTERISSVVEEIENSSIFNGEEIVSNEIIETSTILEESISLKNEEITNSNTIEETIDESIYVELTVETPTENVSNLIFDMFNFIKPFLILMVAFSIVIIIMRIIICRSDICFDFSIGDFFDSISDSYYERRSLDTYLNKKKNINLTNKIIYNSILKSNKKISEEDIEFLQNCIDKKTEWYSFKKELKEVNENEKLFSILLLDTLYNIDKIKEFFKNEENKCEDIKDSFTTDFINYINNENNYFNIGKHYFLKEMVFYILTNNNIKIKELYNYFNFSYRANISCVIANLIESELSLNHDMSITDTLDESLKVFNQTYRLDLNMGLAKNLIFLSKIDNDINLQNVLLNNTNILQDMKQYKHYRYC